MKWTKLFTTDVLEESDFVKRVDVSGKKLCAIKTKGRIFVTQTKCPHAGADLSFGWCSNGNIVCPYHRHEFDLSTGRGKAGQGDYIKVYPIETRVDGIYVGLKDAWWKFW